VSWPRFELGTSWIKVRSIRPTCQLARRNVCSYDLRTHQHMLRDITTVPWCASQVHCSTEKGTSAMRHRCLQFVSMIFIHTCVIFTYICFNDRLCGLVVRVPGYRSRFPVLPDFLRSSETGTGSTQPREDN
jgi:hypothetical protein